MTTDDPYHPPVPGESSLLENPTDFPPAPVPPSMAGSESLQHPTIALEAVQHPVFPYNAYCNMYAAYNPWMTGMVPFPMMMNQEAQMSPSLVPNYHGLGSPSFAMSPMPSPGYHMPLPMWGVGAGTNGDLPKDKKGKKVVGRKFAPEVEKALIHRYNKYNFIQQPEREEFAALIGLEPMQVKIWFQNRRYKQKKKNESEALAHAYQAMQLNGQLPQDPMQQANPYTPSEVEWQENMPPGDPTMY